MDKLDILVFAAHPDDAELACSGTILKHIADGKKVGIVDLTQGELGTRGSAEIRAQESARASELMRLSVRLNLDLGDGTFQNTPETRLKVIRAIRQFQPDVVLCNAKSDRHPDHGRGSELVSEACFYSGLRKIEVSHDGVSLSAWRPKAVYHYIQDRYIQPDFIVDISHYIDKKMDVIKAFKSQFYDPTSTEPSSPISSKSFLDHVKGRSSDHGRLIGAEYGEGFTVDRPLGVEDLTSLG